MSFTIEWEPRHQRALLKQPFAFVSKEKTTQPSPPNASRVYNKKIIRRDA
jgi:hypothetical protein